MHQSEVQETTPLVEKKSNDKPKSAYKYSGWGYRHLVAVMLFWGLFMSYSMRVNLSIALVAMVNTTASSKYISVTPPDEGGNFSTNDLGVEEECSDNSVSISVSKKGEFNWSPETQGIILSSFFYGYITTQLFGGLLAEHIGGKRVFGFGIFMTAFLTVLTPVIARTNVNLFIALRVLEGIFEGVTPPVVFVLLSRWSPALERSKLVAFVFSGNQVGTVVTQPIAGILCDHGFAGGWPSVFYVFGGLGLLWALLWAILVHDSPESDPRISQEERKYIMASRGRADSVRRKLPWFSILTSPPVYAMFFAHFSKNWGFYTLLTTLPTFLKQVLKFDTSQNGFLSSLPYLCMAIVENTGGVIADTVRSKTKVSTTTVRKLHTSLGLILPAILLCSVGYLGCDRTGVVIILIFSTALLGISTSGYHVNHLDIAPHCAGAVWGLVNTVGTIPGMISPLIVEAITQGSPYPSSWQPVFFLASGIYLLGAFVYLLCASGEPQSWDPPPQDPIFNQETDADPENDPKLHSGRLIS